MPALRLVQIIAQGNGPFQFSGTTPNRKPHRSTFPVNSPAKALLQAVFYPLHRIKSLHICHSASIAQDGQCSLLRAVPRQTKTKPISQKPRRCLSDFASLSPPSYRCGLRTYLLNCIQASTNYKEAFALFDKRGNGRVALQSLGDLLRACGQNPTLAEIHDLEKSVGGDCMSGNS